jgi:hypothetical protein
MLSVTGKKFFPITFLGSIMWIAAYSYLMVWWANVSGDTIQIPPEVSTNCTLLYELQGTVVGNKMVEVIGKLT